MFIVLGFYKFKILNSLKKKKLLLQKLFTDNNIKGTLIISKDQFRYLRLQILVCKNLNASLKRLKTIVHIIQHDFSVKRT